MTAGDRRFQADVLMSPYVNLTCYSKHVKETKPHDKEQPFSYAEDKYKRSHTHT